MSCALLRKQKVNKKIKIILRVLKEYDKRKNLELYSSTISTLLFTFSRAQWRQNYMKKSGRTENKMVMLDLWCEMNEREFTQIEENYRVRRKEK